MFSLFIEKVVVFSRAISFKKCLDITLPTAICVKMRVVNTLIVSYDL